MFGRGDVTMQKIASIDNLADPFTKSLNQKLLDCHLEKMGIIYHSASGRLLDAYALGDNI